jgi:hypothetical protein
VERLNLGKEFGSDEYQMNEIKKYNILEFPSNLLD